MIPLYDENPTFRTPIVTIGLIVAIIGIWVFVQGGGWTDRTLATTICGWGMVPAALSHLRPDGFEVRISQYATCVIGHDWINWRTPLTSMFLHGSWGHVLGNALFLWVFGNNVEDVMGRGKFLVFYLICGLIAAGAQVLVDPASPVPTVGASGAISGVLGAYLVLYPRASVRTFFPPVFLFRLPAWIVLIGWFALQFYAGLLSGGSPQLTGGVAVWAHVGGFLAGVVLSHPFLDANLAAQHRAERPPVRRRTA